MEWRTGRLGDRFILSLRLFFLLKNILPYHHQPQQQQQQYPPACAYDGMESMKQ